MKRAFWFLLIMLVPLSFFLAAWQAFTYQESEKELAKLERQQRELFEVNRRLLTTISLEESPARIISRAESELGMVWPAQDAIETLIVEPSGASNGSR